MRRSALWIPMAALAAAGCSDANLAEPEGLGLDAAQYLNVALDIMEARSLHRYEIDWDDFRVRTLEEAGNAKTPAETYDAIRAALVRLDDNHSVFLTPEVASSAPPPPEEPTAVVVGTGTGYVHVPAFSGVDEAGAMATLYHALIEEVDTLDVCRWVVDLRGNTGGNMWPMLGGLGPILGEGTAGYFVDPDSLLQEWSYEGGVATLDGASTSTVEAPYTASPTAPRVAVLTDSLTASSGEAIAIAFRGRDDSRSFGGSTFGVPTANEGYFLSDGALLIVTVARMADRTGEVYAGEVLPDSIVEGAKTGEPATDAVLGAALGWLETMPCS